MTQPAPRWFRTARISSAEATHPSSPASRASRQRWRTCPSTDEGTPSSRPSAARSRLVSTVTAITSGRRPPDPMAAASAAARIMAWPPEAWTLNMNTPRRAASRAAPATVLGMSWYLRSRKTSPPRLRTASTAAGPEAVKSWEPILNRLTSPARRSTRPTAPPSVSTSRATMRRSLGSAVSMVLLERPDGDLSLEQRLDAADRRLGAVHRRVVGDVLRHGGAADDRGVLPRAPVLRGVEDERDVPPLHQVHDVGPLALGDLVDRLAGHALPRQELRRARRRDEGEAHLRQSFGDREQRALVPVLHGEKDLARGGERRPRGELRLDVGLAEVAVDPHDLAGGLHLRPEHGVHAGELDEGEDRLLDGDVLDLPLLREAQIAARRP